MRVIVPPLAIPAVEKNCRARETGNPGTFELIVIDMNVRVVPVPVAESTITLNVPSGRDNELPTVSCAFR